MGSSGLQHQRYELKYQVSEDQALRIRDFVQGYLEIDEYGARQPNLSYPTLSLYLDSDRLDTYWHAINGDRNRFKLRLRYYDDQPDTPVFFEIKRRDNNVILKERGGVRKSAVPLLLAGHMPERQHMLNRNDSEAFLAVQEKWKHSLATGDEFEIEHRFRRYDGLYRWFLGRARPERDSSGRISKWFGSCTEIHDQKMAEQERDLAKSRPRTGPRISVRCGSE